MKVVSLASRHNLMRTSRGGGGLHPWTGSGIPSVRERQHGLRSVSIAPALYDSVAAVFCVRFKDKTGGGDLMVQ